MNILVGCGYMRNRCMWVDRRLPVVKSSANYAFNCNEFKVQVLGFSKGLMLINKGKLQSFAKVIVLKSIRSDSASTHTHGIHTYTY